jgi:hypothetical protein
MHSNPNPNVYDIFRLLIEYGANLELTDNFGWTSAI